MKFIVKILRKAEFDQNVILRYIAERSRTGAAAWAKAFDTAIGRLEESADTFPLAPESEHVDVEVRNVLFKTRRGLVYRALFTIQKREVFVLHIRGPGQELVAADDFGPPNTG